MWPGSRLRLERPAAEFAASFAAMRDACVAAGEDPWPDHKVIAHDDVIGYARLLNEQAAGKNLPDGWVPADTFWILDGPEVVAECDVRHRLTPHLRDLGGHIGYVVHPLHRGRGVATFALRECLKVLAARGETEALLTCAAANAASIRVIENCGGRRIDDSSTGRRRYVIALAAPKSKISLEEYYRNHYDESRRLERGGTAGVERARTLDILGRHLPPPPGVVLDVGGGTGAYAFPLASAGYAVHLIDLVEHHIEEARAICAERPLASCAVGDARALEFSDESADAVLLLGPLYHLPQRAGRLQALREASRVLRPGGVLFAAAIARFAALIDGIESDFIADPAYVDMLDRELRDGHHNPASDPRYFTEAFFHTPDDLRDEVAEAGFSIKAIVGIEGPLWSRERMPGWTDSNRRALIMDLLRRIEEEPTLLGASSHLMAIATKRLRADESGRR